MRKVSHFWEMHNPTHTKPSHDEKFSLSNHLGDLVLSHTSYTSIFCSIHPNEVWVKDFFLIVTHEEYGISISPFEYERLELDIIYIFSNILCYIMMIYIFMGVLMILL